MALPPKSPRRPGWRVPTDPSPNRRSSSPNTADTIHCCGRLRATLDSDRTPFRTRCVDRTMPLDPTQSVPRPGVEGLGQGKTSEEQEDSSMKSRSLCVAVVASTLAAASVTSPLPRATALHRALALSIVQQGSAIEAALVRR